MSLRQVLNLEFNSRVARGGLRLFYRSGRAYRIPFGPLRGRRLFYERAVNFHAVLGLWDASVFRWLDRIVRETGLIPSTAVVADVGANIGYYALWLAARLAPAGHVHAFEPATLPGMHLRRNLLENGVDNVTVVPMACGDRQGPATFYIADHHHSSSLHGSWAHGGQQTTVEMTTLDAYFGPAGCGMWPAFIKMDIEGGGTFALRGCRQCMANRPWLLIESHTPDEDRAISDLLLEWDYEAYRLTNHEWVADRSQVHPHADGVWGTLLVCPSAHRPAIDLANTRGRTRHAAVQRSTGR